MVAAARHIGRGAGARCLALLLLFPAVAATQVELQQQAFAALGQQLQRPDPVRSHAFLDSLGGVTGLDDEGLRRRLRALLDSLEQHRKSKSPTWQTLSRLGDRRATPRQVEKLLRELRKRADKILRKKGDYPLANLLNEAATRADMPEHRARAILFAAIGVDPDPAAVFVGLPSWVGMQLRVRNFSLGGNDVVRLAPHFGDPALPPGGVGAGSPLGRNAVSAPLPYYVQREMAESDHVKWVVLAPVPGRVPECSLHLDILAFATTWRQRSPATAQQPAQFVLNLFMELQVDLYHHALQNVVYTERKEYRYDFPMEMDDETRPGLQFDKYYERIARDVRGSIDAFLSR